MMDSLPRLARSLSDSAEDCFIVFFCLDATIFGGVVLPVLS